MGRLEYVGVLRIGPRRLDGVVQGTGHWPYGGNLTTNQRPRHFQGRQDTFSRFSFLGSGGEGHLPHRGHIHLSRIITQHFHGGAHGGYAIQQRMVHLGIQSEMAAIHRLDQITLPQWTAAIQQVAMFYGDERKQLFNTSGTGQRHMTKMMIDIKRGIMIPTIAPPTFH